MASASSSVFRDPPKNPTLHRLRTRLLNLTLQAFALCVVTVLPAFVTTLPFVAASSIQFNRVDDRVTATTQRYLFFIIPYRTVQIDPVTEIERHSRQGSRTRERRTGRPDKYTQADDQGYLVVKGPATSSEVPANATKLEALEDQADTFLKNPQASELKLYLLGNPTFSLIFGGGATALTALFVGCGLYAAGKRLLKIAGFLPRRSPQGGSRGASPR